ncbi:MAG: recombinase family protein [Planctomycetes bacterium]|nr:recombinase family protein [Planctomycetota bacterium]
MQVVGYVRVSTEGQSVDGVSLEAQEAKIRTYCELNDLTLSHVFVDAGVSAKRADNRPELQKALASVGPRGAKALIVFKLDRLARNTVDALCIAQQLDKAGVALHSLTEKLDTSSALGRFFYTLLASLGEMERNLIAERTAAVHAYKRSKGQVTGHAPFGYRLSTDGVALIEEESEQAALATIKELLVQGYSQRALVVELNKRGMKAKKGGKWNRSSLRSVMETTARIETALTSAA